MFELNLRKLLPVFKLKVHKLNKKKFELIENVRKVTQLIETIKK